MRLWCNVSTVMCMGWGQGRNLGCRSSLRHRQRGHGVMRPQPSGVNQTATAPRRGVRPGRPRSWLRREAQPPRWSGQATDVSVAQPVVDEGEQLAGGGDFGDVRRGVDRLAGPGDRRRRRRWTASRAAQRTRWLPCLVIAHGGPWCRTRGGGGHAGPGAQLLGPGEAGHVPDLGHEHRSQHRPHPGHAGSPGSRGGRATARRPRRSALRGRRGCQ